MSGDKDVYQLVTDRTHVVTTKKGITDVAIYGPAEVEERYGVTPGQFPDFLGLKGDSSDNIPGVPGIGDKTAAKLLQNYGSIDGIYDNLDKLKGKQLQNLTEHKEDAYTSRRVATIVRDVEFDLDLEGVKFPDFDSAKVAEVLARCALMPIWPRYSPLPVPTNRLPRPPRSSCPAWRLSWATTRTTH